MYLVGNLSQNIPPELFITELFMLKMFRGDLLWGYDKG